jgi:pimeloyl-ACP methyl ester carboxylesterase
VETVTSKDGTTIALDRSGEGPPIIVVGGALSTAAAAEQLAGLLSAEFTLVPYDRRGRGGSGDTAPYAVEREIEDLDAVIAEVGGSAFALGHSSGAALALEATARGSAITRLALYEPPYITDDSRPPLPDDYVAHLDELTAANLRGDAIEYFMTVGVGVPAEAVAPMRDAPYWPSLETVAHTIRYDARIMGDHMSGAPLPAGGWAGATVPTLVMDGGASDPWIRHSARALAEVLPSAEYRTLEGQTHEVAPDVLAPVLTEFFGT